jgi:hypothetical protein
MPCVAILLRLSVLHKKSNTKKSGGSTAGRGKNIKNATNCSEKDPLIRACQTAWAIFINKCR